MRDQIFQSGVPLVIGGVCLLALGYLASGRRDRFVTYWTVAWGFLVLRFAWVAGLRDVVPLPGGLGVYANPALRLAFAGALLAGGLELRGRRVPGWWLLATVPLMLALLRLDDVLRPAAPGALTILVAAAVMTWAAAWLLAAASALPGRERGVVAAALAIYGAVTAVAGRLPDTTVAFRALALTSWSTQLLVGVGLIAMFYRMAADAELEAQRRLGATLASALSEYMVICMHCKSVRDTDTGWQRLEQYVAARSTTQFSHGLCPSCAAAHYDLTTPDE